MKLGAVTGILMVMMIGLFSTAYTTQTQPVSKAPVQTVETAELIQEINTTPFLRHQADFITVPADQPQQVKAVTLRDAALARAAGVR